MTFEKRKHEIAAQYKDLPFLSSNHKEGVKVTLFLEYHEVIKELKELTRQLEGLNLSHSWGGL